MTTYDPIVYGSNDTERIVNVSVKHNKLHIFQEHADGTVTQTVEPFRYFLLADSQLDSGFQELDGNLDYRWIKLYSTQRKWREEKGIYKHDGTWAINDEAESAMVTLGYTYFKGMEVKDVSILCWDIETTGLVHDRTSKVLLISNTFRSATGEVTKKLFSYDDYDNPAGIFRAWAKWVREMNPSVMAGYNCHTFDWPYMVFCAARYGVDLALGRDDSVLGFEYGTKKFRVDQHRFIEYRQPAVFGREVLDLMFTTQKWDIGKRLDNYKLKSVVAQEGLQKAGRVFYDAGMIKDKYQIPEEWKKIKAYAIDDADDTLAVFDHVIDAYFYSSQCIPKTFTNVTLTASGSQLNSMMVRAYLQEGHSVPQASEKIKYQGAISFGNPGIYRNVFKVDVASLYPSIIETYDLYDREKDPKGIYKYLNNTFRSKRLEYKKLAKDTGKDFYKAMDATFKAFVNSVYGMAGAAGLNFNSPHTAAEVTRVGREVLNKSIEWAEGRGFQVTNADTDSISFTDSGKPIENPRELLSELNGLYPSGIRFEDDGMFKAFVVIKAKNYLMLTPEGKKKLKGSGLKSSKIEPGFKKFNTEVIDLLLGITPSENIEEAVLAVYNRYASAFLQIEEIRDWASKKSISEKTLKSTRKNERLLVEALAGTPFSPGDRFHFYYTKEDVLKLAEHFSHDHNVPRLLRSLFNKMKIFGTVVDVKKFPNYALKKNYPIYNQLVGQDYFFVKPKKEKPVKVPKVPKEKAIRAKEISETADKTIKSPREPRSLGEPRKPRKKKETPNVDTTQRCGSGPGTPEDSGLLF